MTFFNDVDLLEDNNFSLIGHSNPVQMKHVVGEVWEKIKQIQTYLEGVVSSLEKENISAR